VNHRREGEGKTGSAATRTIAPVVNAKTLAGAALLALLASIGCANKKPPKPGDACKIEEEGSLVCQDAMTALLCRASRRTAIACRGPKGCGGEQHPTCDATLAREGDPCHEVAPPWSGVEASGGACSEDRTELLACEKGSFVLAMHCRGSKGCDPGVSSPLLDPHACDRSVVQLGDECNVSSGYARRHDNLDECTVDGKAAATCDTNDNGKFVVNRMCVGPNGCRVGHLSGMPEAPMAVCDLSVVPEGAPCGAGDINRLTCSSDGALLLRCDREKHAFEKEEACGPKRRCHPFDGVHEGFCEAL
jgi:hypothetical protein